MSFIDGTSDRSVTAPRHWLQIGGALIPLLTSHVTRKSTQNADTFSATLAIGASEPFGFGLAEWADWNPSQDAGIVYANRLDGSDRQSMISGTLDRPEVKLADMTVSITGRDKSSKLMENRRNEKFQNQKSSDIATKIAQDAGLNPVVVDTGDFAGKAYTSDIAHLVQNRMDYEVMSLLAEREAYRWFVQGDDLYFEPKTSDSDVYAIMWSPPGTVADYAVANCIDLTLAKNSTAGRPTTVEYAGWHHGKKKLFKATASAGGVGTPVKHRFHFNGNTQSQLEKKAKSRLNDFIRHELGIIAVLPGDLSLDPRMQVSLTGTGTVYDQSYPIDSIDFEMGWDQEFTMTVDAKSARQGRS